MNLYIYDLESQNDILVDLEVEYTIPSNDLYAAFYSRDVVCSFGDDKTSNPYNEYLFKKVNHIIGGTIIHKGKKYSIELGFYLDNSEFTPFIISQTGSDGYIRFNTSEATEHYYKFQALFNYKEYTELAELIGLENLSFKQFVCKVINGEIDRNNYSLYDTSANRKLTFENTVNSKDFSKFLDKEESRLATI